MRQILALSEEKATIATEWLIANHCAFCVQPTAGMFRVEVPGNVIGRLLEHLREAYAVRE